MRISLTINPMVMEQAMKAGPFKTKKAAVEAGLKLLARRTAYREILQWEGKLCWDGQPLRPGDPEVGASDPLRGPGT